MGPSLAGVDLKLKRANEHLTLLDAEVGAFKRKGHAIVGEFDADASEYVFRVDGEPPPLRWGVPVSEIAHLWRSSLDNLFWQLVRANNNTPHERAEFPIFKDEALFDKRESEPRSQGVSAEGWTLIKKAQPFKAGPNWYRRDPLWLLHELNRLDKHRFVHIGFIGMAISIKDDSGITRSVPLTPEAPYGDLLQPGHNSIQGLAFPSVVKHCTGGGVRFTGGGSDDRTEIVRAECTKTGPNPEMQMQPGLALDISLGDPQVPVVLADLRRIGRRMDEVINPFRAFFIP